MSVDGRVELGTALSTLSRENAELAAEGGRFTPRCAEAIAGEAAAAAEWADDTIAEPTPPDPELMPDPEPELRVSSRGRPRSTLGRDPAAALAVKCGSPNGRGGTLRLLECRLAKTREDEGGPGPSPCSPAPSDRRVIFWERARTLRVHDGLPIGCAEALAFGCEEVPSTPYGWVAVGTDA
jgi:hypothetical protein